MLKKAKAKLFSSGFLIFQGNLRLNKFYRRDALKLKDAFILMIFLDYVYPHLKFSSWKLSLLMLNEAIIIILTVKFVFPSFALLLSVRIMAN